MMDVEDYWKYVELTLLMLKFNIIPWEDEMVLYKCYEIQWRKEEDKHP